MTNSPLVSIITPTFNHQNYIEDCINSVLNQTYQNWEMIIINDGSTDKTLEKIEKFRNKDSRIKLIDQENLGIFSLNIIYNKALNKSNGKYIAILEGDDVWEDTKLEIQLKKMESDESIVLCWSKAYAKNFDLSKTMQVIPNIENTKLEWLNNNPRGSILNVIITHFIPPVTVIIRKKNLDNIGGFLQVKPFPAVDLSTFLALSLEGSFFFIDQVLGTWRVSTGQITKNNMLEINNGSKKIITQHYNNLPLAVRSLITFDEKKLEKIYLSKETIIYSRLGRMNLINKNYRQARLYYLKSLGRPFFSNFMWKVRSIIGLIFSFLRLDVEYIAEKFGKGSIK